MTSAAETFVVTLARASKRADRYLRGLSSADRDDVLATAVLWCWENRTTYEPAVSLDNWFISAIRHAKRDWRRGKVHDAEELKETLAVPDDTSWNVELQQAVAQLLEGMDAMDHQIVDLRAEGWEQDEIAKQLNVTTRTVKRKLDRLRAQIPESVDFHQVVHRAKTPPSDDVSDEQAPIDKAIERLDFAPPAGKDCPPCWRCKWFEGYLPGNHRPTRMQIVEPEIRAAVFDVEARKIEIAERVRKGGS